MTVMNFKAGNWWRLEETLVRVTFTSAGDCIVGLVAMVCSGGCCL